MKKLILVLAFGTAIAANADYLYWMVDTTDMDTKYQDFTTIVLRSTESSSIQSRAVDYSDVSDYYDNGYYFTYSGTLSDTASYFVELYNGDTWVAESAKMAYSDLLTGGSIFKGGLQPAAITPANFGSYAVPEPTSGVLFLLGGMLLGLKRRRQKV